MSRIKTRPEDSKTLGELMQETRVLQRIEQQLKEAEEHVMHSL